MNNCIFVGRMASEVTVRTSNSGTLVANFRFAVQRPYTKDKVDFFNLTAFGKTADAIERYVSKGDQIAVECSAQADEYTDRDGNKRYAVSFIVNRFDFGAKKSGSGSDGRNNADGGKTAQNGSDGTEWDSIPDDDDLPF